MVQLLSKYSIEDILLVLAMTVLAIKEVVSLWGWMIERFNAHFNKEHKTEDTQTAVKNLCEKVTSLKDSIEKLSDLTLEQGTKIAKIEDSLSQTNSRQKELEEKLTQQDGKIDMLIDSDKDDIKAFITREHHHFCYDKHWIDDFTMDCIERRYEHYDAEGGNSFIHGLMDELRALPKKPVQK